MRPEEDLPLDSETCSYCVLHPITFCEACVSLLCPRHNVNHHMAWDGCWWSTCSAGHRCCIEPPGDWDKHDHFLAARECPACLRLDPRHPPEEVSS